jgi:hypothetical protein
MPTIDKKTDLCEVTEDGKLRLHFHRGQWQAWQSKKRFVAVIAGTQSGKTSFGPLWLWKEIREQGRGDYLVATPTFTLLELKVLPEFKRLFERYLKLGRYLSTPIRKFTFSEAGERALFGDYDPNNPTHVFFGYAEDPESLESATVKAAWLDEAGQRKFKQGSWEAIQRRLAIHEGRALITTTPYDLGWLKKQIYDRWKSGDGTIDLIRFDSTENPAFSQEEYDRAKANLPLWKFNLFYRGIFTRPAGMIYDSFDEDRHMCPRFTIPDEWERYLGMDFGGVNTAGLFYAAEPETRRLYLYRSYKHGGRTAGEHILALLKGEPCVPYCVGGSRSEGQWRKEFQSGGIVEGRKVQGLPIRQPDIKEVEVGIDRVYGAHRRDEIIVFDDLEDYLDEKRSYCRKLGPDNEPTEDIDDKSAYHYMDAERYIIGWLRRSRTAQNIPETAEDRRLAGIAEQENKRKAQDRWLQPMNDAFFKR